MGMKPEQRSISIGSQDDESPLVRAAQAGDAKAFAEIVRRYQRAMYRLAYGYLRSRPSLAWQSDDMLGDAMLAAHVAHQRCAVSRGQSGDRRFTDDAIAA